MRCPELTNGSTVAKRKAVMRADVALAVIWLCLGWEHSVLAEADAGEPVLPRVTPEQIGYSVRHWTVEDGLPQRVITSLAQTPDGYLWCGTTAGLLRFDGNRFRFFSSREVPELKDVEVLELLCDSAGRLWIGGIDGQVVLFEQGRFRRFGEADGIPQVREPKFGQDPTGDFWINGRSTGKFYRFRNGRFEAVTWPGMKPNMIDRFRANEKGEIWGVHEQERTLVHLTAKGVEAYSLTTPQGQPERSLGRFFDLQDGSLAVNSVRGIYAFDGSEWKLRHEFGASVPANMLDGIQDRVGNFWVSGYRFGLVFSDPAGLTAKVSLPDAVANTFIRSMLLDSEGNVWAGGDDGLYRLRRKAFRPQPVMARQVLETYSSAVMEDAKGGIWLFDVNGWYRPTGHSWTYVVHGYNNRLIWSVVATRNGSVLVGYRALDGGPRQLEEITPTGQRSVIATLPRDVEVMLSSRTGVVWIGAEGLWKLEAGRLRSIPLEGTNGFVRVDALAEDPEGRLFVGDRGNGLFQQTDHGWQKLTTGDDVGSDRIVGLHFDSEGTLWIATSLGIARWKDGRWFAHEPDPDVHAWIRAITCDNQGYLWMISALGVSRITLKSLNDLAEGRTTGLVSEEFTRADGLPTLEGAGRQGSLLVASDGRIWAATQKGFAVMDPAEWKRRRQLMRPAPVHIESILVDDQILPGIIPKAFVVPPGKRRVEIRFAAVSLQGGTSRYRYRLHGADDTWVDLGEQRFAVFHGLPPGDYRFQVTAENKYGMRDDVGAAIPFYVQPHWWQTNWFRGGTLALFLAAVWLSRAITLRQVERQKQRREEFARQLIQTQEAERKRLAGELHDDLGQDLLVIKSRLDTSRQDVDPAEQRGLVGELSGSVANLIRKVREISHALRPLQLERLGLSSCARGMVEEVSEATGINIETDIDDLRGQLSSTTEIGLYRILQEALNNVVKHSDASEVCVALKCAPGRVILSVKDDGRGFSLKRQEELGDAMGHGLAGMAERCRLMGGQFQALSSPGQGTSIRVEAPVGDGPALQ